MTDPVPDTPWRGRRVAITGATGFVGHHLAVLLRRAGAAVVAVTRAGSAHARLESLGARPVVAELDDGPALAAALRGSEYLFHLAGAVDFRGDWDRFQRVNVLGTRTVLGAARDAGVRRTVHVSSIVAVGATTSPRVLDEAAPWNLEHLRVPYITTKWCAEQVAREAAAAGLDVVVVGPGCVLGPDDHAGSEFGTLCRRFWRGHLGAHFPGGNNFVDVRDVAAGILQAADRGARGERYILGGRNLSYGTFFAELARLSSRTLPRLRLPAQVAPWLAWLHERLGRNKPSRPYLSPAQARLMGLYFFCDSGKARRELGYRPRPLRDTLRDTHASWLAGCHGKRARQRAA